MNYVIRYVTTVMKKLRVGILCGGKSTEHEVSLWSAKNVLESLDRDRFQPVLIAIDRAGQWFLPERDPRALESGLTDVTTRQEGDESVMFLPESHGQIGVAGGVSQALDVIFPVLHGGAGEDGTIQGLLRLSGVPFVGAGVLGSAIGMDKDVMKRLLRDAGIPVARFLTIRRATIPSYESVVETLGTPVFVKPANAGSSVGVHKVKNHEGYERALRDAFLYDTKVLIEESIVGREIEVSVLGNDHPEASIPGEIIPTKEFYTYEAKYLDEAGARLEIPAKLSQEQIAMFQEVACHAFRVLECAGLARVDFFLRENGEILVNEINTLPGFTAISMYPKLWEASGLSYTDLLTRLIDLALERHQAEQGLSTTYITETKS